MRAVNAAGLALIKQWESLRLDTYLCKAGKLTIGWGHTGPDVFWGKTINRDEAERLFLGDIQKHSLGLEPFVSAVTTQNEWAALVSLAFNFGVHAIGTSTLVKKLNAGETMAAADQFLRWKYLDDDRSPEVRHMVEDAGLLARRREERALFLLPDEPVRVA